MIQRGRSIAFFVATLLFLVTVIVPGLFIITGYLHTPRLHKSGVSLVFHMNDGDAGVVFDRYGGADSVLEYDGQILVVGLTTTHGWWGHTVQRRSVEMQIFLYERDERSLTPETTVRSLDQDTVEFLAVEAVKYLRENHPKPSWWERYDGVAVQTTEIDLVNEQGAWRRAVGESPYRPRYLYNVWSLGLTCLMMVAALLWLHLMNTQRS